MSYFEHDDAIRSMIRRAQLLSVNDGGTQQLVDLSGFAGDKPKRVLRSQPFGLSSNPPAGSDGHFFALGGRSDRGVYFDGGHEAFRPRDTPPGAAVLYDDQGNVIFAKSSLGIVIKSKKGDVTVEPEFPGKNVYLGGDGLVGIYAKVETVSGPALNVLARIA